MRRVVLALCVLLALLLGAPPATARVGGGHSYSGGGGGGGGYRGGGGGGYRGGGGGGSSDGGAELVYLIVWCFQHPKVGIPLLSIVAVIALVHHTSQGSQRFGSGNALPRRRRRRRDTDLDAPLDVEGPRASPWARLAAGDPTFSRVVLIDFLTRLVVRFQQAQGEGDAEALRPYLAPKVLDALLAARAQNAARRATIFDVVVGGVELKDVRVGQDGQASFTAVYELNHGVRGAGPARHYYSRVAWRLERAAGARSPTPEGARVLGCPSCGAPVSLNENNRCAYCDQVVDAGRFTWRVSGVSVLDKRPVDDRAIAPSGGIERGTLLPDVVDPRLPAAREALERRYPGFDWSGLEGFARDVFVRLQAAWTAQAFEAARPFETDALYQTHRFYLDDLVRRGLQNRIERVKVEYVRLVRVENDPYYDAVTFRLGARALDYTVDRDERVVSGSRRTPRRFSEYWTFVRSAGFERGKGERDLAHCPSCGGPLELNQAGDCAHCGSTVTSGRFGWVLAAIEQDEAYQG